MPRHDMRPVIRLGGVVVLIAAGLLSACGSDDPERADDAAPSDEALAEVLDGLPRMVSTGVAAEASAGAGDFEAVVVRYQELREIWEGVQGTVRDTDPDAHDAIQGAQQLIKQGGEEMDADAVSRGAGAQAEAVDEYLRAHG